MSPAVAAAWEKFFSRLKEVNSFLYSSRWAGTPDVRLQAHQMAAQIPAFAWNWVMAPRTDYPRFTLHLKSEPNVFSVALFNPDFLYRGANVDGGRTYRIWGKRGTSLFLDFQVSEWEDGQQDPQIRSKRKTFNFQLDNFDIRPDGTFEIIASADRREGNWIQLPSSPHVGISVREAIYDWTNATKADLHIEVADGRPLGSMVLDEKEFIRRLGVMGDFCYWVADNWGTRVVESAYKAANEKMHRFAWQNLPVSGYGTNPAAHYCTCLYNLSMTDALIIEFEEPTSLYWGVQLGNVLDCDVDFVYHQSSLNPNQIHRDGDGRIRMVLSRIDPGIQNWLDPFDTPLGFIQFRQYFAPNPVAMPTTNLVKVDEVLSHLPKNTPKYSPRDRETSLRNRRLAILSQYGY